MNDGPWLEPKDLRVCLNAACVERYQWAAICRCCYTKTEPLTKESEPCERDERKRQR